MAESKRRAGSRFHVMAKPTGPLCNLDCTYCFYLHKRDLLETACRWQMSEEVLEDFIRQYIAGQNYNEVVFSWQGGEPTLRGLDFFEKVIALQKKHNPDGKTIQNDLQTNGVLLDEHWCRFLRQNDFLVGLSIDGPQDLHDRYRRDPNGRGTFEKVVRAADLLKQYGITFNTLTSVNRDNARRPLEVYRFLRDAIGPRAIQFNPVVEAKVFESQAPPFWGSMEFPPIGHPMAEPGNPYSIVTEWSVNAEEYGDFLCAIWDEWYEKDCGQTFVYNFECTISQWMGIYGVMCAFGPICGKGLAIEHDGTVYSCDHFVYPEYRLGTIQSTPLAGMAFSPEQVKFGLGKSQTLPDYCRRCEFLFAYYGECPKNRLLRTSEGQPGLNYLCGGLKHYFTHIRPDVETLIRRIRRQHNNPVAEGVRQ